MAKTTSTGVTLYAVAALPATETKIGWEALSWVKVGEVVDLPSYGPNVSVVESKPLEKGVVQKYNGFVNHGSLAVGLEQDLVDAGQIVLQGALPDANGAFKPVSFKIAFTDAKVDYFHGGVFSFTTDIGSADSMIGATVNVEINSKVYREVAP